MKKIFILLSILLTFISFSDENFSNQYAQSITKEDLFEHLSVLANDNMKGRLTGSQEQKMCAYYIAEHFAKNEVMKIANWVNDSTQVYSYFQKFYLKEYYGGQFSLMINPTPENIKSKGVMATENVLGLVEGTDKKEEFVVISAHYDHIGTKNGTIYNGADDDGSGTVAMMEIAQAFAKAKKEGHPPRRSILFIAFTGEEQMLLGSSYYVQNPLIPLKNIICDLNIDMVGRIDRNHKKNHDYVYLVGSDRISKSLHQLSEETNRSSINLQLDYKYNAESDPERIYYRSDHFNFATYGIPVIFYTSGLHPDYHESTDDLEKIDFEILQKRTQLIFHTAWEIANREEGLK
jgi:Peptidase family M28